ncbi:reticulon-1 [Takifugu rubripes]|uniref:Reticulon n=1 Tax=Takifugu rubripes TaxID=31033 RepID=Q4G5X5_TAKRU|nr:reticulon-1 [Takifugu rubripes]AAT64095.1 reticulon 1-A1 [Takifugu rubripes]|eukprot:NP_001033315.1 reticulon-1 [Takifugu rubripes]
MSAEELGSEGRWFGDDYERNGLFGNAPTQFGELREDFKPRGSEVSSDLDQQFHPYQDDGQRPSVTMETASTDDSMSGLARKSMNDDGDVYTSLLSGQSFASGQGSSYLSDSLKASETSLGSSGLGDFSSDSYSFSSNIKMASGLADDMPKSLFSSDKTESYNYMDISHGDERHDQRLGDKGSKGHDSLGGYIDKNPGGDEDDEEEEEEEEENLGPALGSHSFPYVEEPSDEELSDYRSYRNLGGTPQTASPVKITLTESQPTSARPDVHPAPPPVSVSERENILSVGLQGVPTVTLSEPEDDSPASSPNASPTQKEFRSDDMFKDDAVKPPACKGPSSTNAGGREQDGSSAESGDSEIELVSEEPPKASGNPFAQPPKSKGTVSQPNNPFDSPPAAPGGCGLAGNHAPPTAYSILREEREAELDSDLFIESASEESPKREQGFGGLKQGVSPPSPLVPSVVSPRSTSEAVPAAAAATERVKTPVKSEEDYPAKPKPPTAAVPPEIRSERPQKDDMHENASEGKGDPGKPTASIFPGLNKQKAIDLLYWRNVKQSGAVFSSVLLLLFSLTQFSVVSVGAYLALAALSATISFRIYKSVLQAVQKTDEGHPFKSYLEMEITLSQDQISKYADKILLYSNTCVKELRRLFLVQDLVDSLKFAVLMWLLTYVGALFNGLTLLILAVVSMFTMPVVYEKHQAQIDQYVGLIRTHVNSVVGKIQAKIPGAKRKEE